MTGKSEGSHITPPSFGNVKFLIRGSSPLVMHKFSDRTLNALREKQALGSAGSGKKIREPKDFERIFKEAIHQAVEGWNGIPCTAFRAGLVRACSLTDVPMTKAKLAIDVHSDGFSIDGTALVRITKGEPKPVTHAARNATGVVDIRTRPMWDPGWEACPRVRFDEDMMTYVDVGNLMQRLGIQVGLLEGRPFSKASVGMGWGTFEIIEAKAATAKSKS